MEVALEIQKFPDSVDCKIPQTVGAIDGTHIGINSLTGDSKIDYFNRKQMYSIAPKLSQVATLSFMI